MPTPTAKQLQRAIREAEKAIRVHSEALAHLRAGTTKLDPTYPAYAEARIAESCLALRKAASALGKLR